ncbi:acyl-CoA N-acyltransferase [Cryphonectria parasitica EP155]|uniref:Acyl-CoA N-acyltransferase n=1 Tax=Cryphonectria parasitica (strain ATCC 38755 / EP155) TaxID=660469 RepID=A0A9P4Y059_CRYP1|nr:acyl-CoA N-acyltransferase [Cryphonectria parasitica EP155]KAF3764131.1 acyl-CoA N-acyltransferase [Cryphonectria parasitica EP155]
MGAQPIQVDDTARDVAGLRLDLAHAWRSQRLVYRSISADDEDDLGIIQAINADPVNVAMSGGGMLRPPTKSSTKGIASALEASLLAVMICLPASADAQQEDSEGNGLSSKKPVPIGFICLDYGGQNPVHPTTHNRSATLGLALAAAHQSNGFGPEAIDWVLNWAFRFGNLHSVSLDVVEYNDRARKAYKKIGFVYEGRSREVIFSNERYWDMVHYSILDREWKAARLAAGHNN